VAARAASSAAKAEEAVRLTIRTVTFFIIGQGEEPLRQTPAGDLLRHISVSKRRELDNFSKIIPK
jgi:hypothetical protein